MSPSAFQFILAHQSAQLLMIKTGVSFFIEEIFSLIFELICLLQQPDGSATTRTGSAFKECHDRSDLIS